MHNCKPSYFPMEQNCNLKPEEEAHDIDADQYRRLLRRLLYLTVTRPDITYSVNTFCQFMNSPKHKHMDEAYWVLRYIKTTPGQGILLPSSNDLKLVAHCDADWGGCPLTRRSCTGFIITLGTAPIS